MRCSRSSVKDLLEDSGKQEVVLQWGHEEERLADRKAVRARVNGERQKRGKNGERERKRAGEGKREGEEEGEEGGELLSILGALGGSQ